MKLSPRNQPSPRRNYSNGKKISIEKSLIILIFSVTFCTLCFFNGETIENDITTAILSMSDDYLPPQSEEPLDRPPKCTPEQRSQMLKQLTPDSCNKEYGPWLQKCSFTLATKCPDTTWIDSHYESIHEKAARRTNTATPDNTFVAVYVGCNKGFDAINALRMGTGNSKYNKKAWASQMNATHASVCNQNEAFEFKLQEGDDDEEELVTFDGTVHCIEPISITANRLKDSAKNLRWDDKLLVTEAAISKEVGVQYFPKLTVAGVENKGLDECKNLKKSDPDAFKESCDEVPLYSLDHYMENVAEKKDDGRVHLLSIDVEGYDFDVLLGANHTLTRTEYLEFEYNWMGSWSTQNLIDAVNMLDELGFTCYWAGVGRAWRIDESCWLDHFSWHSWSNVACANRLINAKVAKNMEETFIKTLEEEGITY